jgi:hypothetical protein
LFSRSLTEQPSGCGTSRLALGIAYNKADEERADYEVRAFRHNSATAFDEDVDPFDAAHVYFDTTGNPEPSTVSPKCGGDFSIMSLDPTKGVGSVATAWVAGDADEKTRSFVAHTEIGTLNKKIGRGYFGFGPSMVDLISARNGTASGGQVDFITGFVCNWAGPGGYLASGMPANQFKSLVQRQDVLQDDNGKFDLDVDGLNRISYAPQADCSYTDPNGTGTPPTLRLVDYPPSETPTPNPVADGVVAVSAHNLLTIGDDDAPLADLRSPAVP